MIDIDHYNDVNGNKDDLLNYTIISTMIMFIIALR